MSSGSQQADSDSTTDAQETNHAWRAFAVGSASIFLFVLDAGLVSVALPEIELAFPNSSRATISWASTGYLVALAGLMLVAGRLGDIYGRKRLFLGGLLVQACAAVLAGVAPAIWFLIGARMMQGVGGALVTAVGLTLVLPAIPEERRPFAIGIWGAIGSTAAVMGPTVGAAIADATNWRLTVALIAPLSLIAYAAGRPILRESAKSGEADQLDATSVLLATVSIAALALGLSQSGVWGWSDARTISSLVLGAIGFVTFVVRSLWLENPVIDLRLFANRTYSGATLAAGVQQLGFFSWFFSTSFVLRQVWGWSISETGYAISLAFVFSAMTGWIAGAAAERVGYFWPVAVGAVVAAAGPAYWFLTFEAEPALWSVYVPGAILFGAGGGACGVLTTGIALQSLPEADQGMGYAAHQTARRMSSAAGLALMVTLLGEATGSALLDGGRNVWLMSAAAHLCMIAPIFHTRHTRPGV